MSSVVAIHDLSLWSKSSLSVVLPVLEAMNHEVFMLPTMILSTQSDGYPILVKKDLSADIYSFYEQVKEYGYSFDAVYSGYLGNAEIIESVDRIMKEEDALTLVDPVLGDNGELYQGMVEENIASSRKLVEHADIITPNITEASILTGMSILNSYSNEDIRSVVSSLRKIGPERGVITSVPLSIGKLGNVAYEADDMRIFAYEDLCVSYPGSGDLFASLFLSLHLAGYSYFPSARMSGEMTTRAIRYAKETKRERRMGISLVPVMNDIREVL